MEAAQEFGRLVGPLRRALLRTRLRENVPDIPEAQIEVLRALDGAGPMTPKELAGRLRVAPSTISNLLRTMAAAGLVRRTPSAVDLRIVDVTLTPKARGLLGRYDRVSEAAMQDAFGRLTAPDRRALERAVPALRALLQALEDDPPTDRRDATPS
jgi:DNA-binding MarR family transcriptional regulator